MESIRTDIAKRRTKQFLKAMTKRSVNQYMIEKILHTKSVKSITKKFQDRLQKMNPSIITMGPGNKGVFSIISLRVQFDAVRGSEMEGFHEDTLLTFVALHYSPAYTSRSLVSMTYHCILRVLERKPGALQMSDDELVEMLYAMASAVHRHKGEVAAGEVAEGFEASESGHDVNTEFKVDFEDIEVRYVVSLCGDDTKLQALVKTVVPTRKKVGV